jgi:hypothetical protein
VRLNQRQLRTGAALVAAIFGLFVTIAKADERPLMRGVILPDLIPNAAQQFVPMAVDLPANFANLSRIEIVALMYCGGDNHGGANALGVVYPDRSAPSAAAMRELSCSEPLSNIAGRLEHSSGAPDWVEVINTHITWTPWQLRFAVIDAASASNAGHSAPSLQSLGEIKNFVTSNLQILPPPGDNYRFDVAIGFRNSTIVVAIFQNSHVASPQQFLSSDPLLDAEISAAPAQANFLADAQYGFVNDLLRIYAPSYEIPIHLQNATQPMLAKHVQVSGGDNTMTAAGQLSRGEIVYNATVLAQGNDLTISQITLDAPTVNCTGDDLMERMRCQGQQAVLGASSTAIASALTNYYQGQPFRYSTVDHPLRFTLGDTEFSATVEALKSSSRASTISEAGRASIQKVTGEVR